MIYNDHVSTLSVCVPTGIPLVAGSYKYTSELLELEAATPPSETRYQRSPESQDRRKAWEPYLSSLPDQRFAAFMRRGLENGFRIGVDRSHGLQARATNMPSAAASTEIVDKYIAEEVRAGNLQTITDGDKRLQTHCSPIGLIPKHHQPGKYRLIVNLSAPEGSSINDAISSDLASVQYTTVRKAALQVAAMGRGALLAKLDIHSAYRKVPVHQADRNLLGINWKGQVYQDQALPFGLRSAPKLFTAVADTLAWALACEGVEKSCHYLDDFLFWSEKDSTECARSLQVATQVCTKLGLPPAPGKTEGPSSKLTFLGIEFDTEAQELRLPQQKLSRLKASLRQWESRTNPSKRQLQSMIGTLKHAASVVRPGHLFTRNLIEDMKRPRGLDQRTRLTRAAKADLAWWALLADEWNGTSFLPGSLQVTKQSPVIISDASGSWGCGAYLEDSKRWLQLQWPETWSKANIACKELVPIIAAAVLWGHEWYRQVVLFRSDNMSVVLALNSMSARDPILNRLLTILFFVEAYLQFDHKAKHIAGKDNRAADAISRNKFDVFISTYPQAPKSPVPFPPSLRELLCLPEPDWTSPSWRSLLKNSLQAGWQAEPEHRTPQHREDI